MVVQQLRVLHLDGTMILPQNQHIRFPTVFPKRLVFNGLDFKTEKKKDVLFSFMRNFLRYLLGKMNAMTLI